jgi:hypothetical protein
VEVGLTDREPLAEVDVNVPGVIAILVAPSLVQLSMLLDPAAMLVGLDANDLITGTEPDVGGGGVVVEAELSDEPPQPLSDAVVRSISAKVCRVGHTLNGVVLLGLHANCLGCDGLMLGGAHVRGTSPSRNR